MESVPHDEPRERKLSELSEETVRRLQEARDEANSRQWLERVAEAVRELLEAQDRLQEVGRPLLGRRTSWTPEEQMRVHGAAISATRAMNALRACYHGFKAAGSLPIAGGPAFHLAGATGATAPDVAVDPPARNVASGMAECWPFGRNQRV